MNCSADGPRMTMNGTAGAGQARASSPRCVVVVPTYNEAESIMGFLNGVLAATAGDVAGGPDALILVVDDSNPDGTAALVKSHPEFGRRVSLLLRSTKDGLGSAYRAGFAVVLAAGYDVVVQIDADGSHPVAAIPAMTAALADHDIVIGSRYVPGGETLHWSSSRHALSVAANVYARRTLDLRTRDATAGFRAWRSSALKRIGVASSESEGYCFQIENTWRAERAGLSVAEHPITFADRRAGASKMSAGVALEALIRVARWRLRELTARAARWGRPSRGVARSSVEPMVHQ
jgi:dolichol-phosphate mannosyltransferase